MTIFTDLMIRKLKPEEKKYIRSEGNGFTIRVMPSSVKTWLYIYAIDGKRREMNLGTYPEVTLGTARSKFEDAKRKVKNGVDPVAEIEELKEGRRKTHTVSELVEEFITRHAKVRRKKSWEEDERILNKDVVPRWGKRKITEIRKGDILGLSDQITNRQAPAMSNNTFRVIRAMFNWAVEQDYLEVSPTIKIKKLPNPKISRDRVLSFEEIKIFWKALDDISISLQARNALKLVLITAQRSGEVSGMHTCEIDGDWWTIPKERSKNGVENRVFLTPLAKEIIQQTTEQVKRERSISADTEYKGFIFPCPHVAKVKAMDRHALSRALARNFAWPITGKDGKQLFGADGKPATENRMGIEEHFTPHDLRRTAGTRMAELGEMDEVIDAVMNHKKKGVTAVYIRYRYDKEKQAALESWERKLRSIVFDCKTENVININSARKVA